MMAMDSRDVLFLTLAVCAAVLTAGSAWLLYYLVRIIRTVAAAVDDFRQRLATIDGILQTIKDKLSSTHLQLAALAAGLKQLISFFASRRVKRRPSTRASTPADEF